MSAEKDQKLVKAILRGENHEVLEYLYKSSLPKIKNMVKRFGGTIDDAKDVFQDGVVILYRKIKSGEFAQYDNPEAFLHTMCRNIWLNKMKRDSKITHPSYLPDREDDQANILHHYELKEKDELIQKIFDQLGERCAKLLKMIYIQQYDTEEIAKAMEMASTDVVKTTKNRCKNKLMELLQDQPQLAKALSNRE